MTKIFPKFHFFKCCRPHEPVESSESESESESEPEEEPPKPTPAAKQVVENKIPPTLKWGVSGGSNKFVKVIHKYDAEEDDEMDMEPIEMLKLLESPDDEGWALAVKEDGTEGMIPIDFTDFDQNLS